MSDKAALRKQFKAARKQLTAQQLEDLSIQIANRCLQLDIWKGQYYHLFLSIEKQREIDTSFLLHILHGRDKAVVVSKSNFEDNSLQHFLLEEHTKLKVSEFGIPEPEDGLEVPPHKLDVVFVPLLAFGKNGHRIGYGKGFYDRFLAQCDSQCIFVGLSFFEPVGSVPHQDNDIPLHYGVCPSGTYKF